VFPPPSGKRISSRNTFFMKRIFPVIWFGFIAVFFVTAALDWGRGRSVPAAAYLAPLLLVGVGYFIMRRFVFDLADEVFDEGDALLVRFGSEEERIPLAQIINVSYAGMTNPPRITLTLRNPGCFGKEVSFSPQQSFLSPFFRTNPMVNDLIERVDAARRR